MTQYAAEHASALRDIREAGAPVEFHYRGRESVSGFALQVEGAGLEYEPGKFIERSRITLLFVPENYGDTPLLGSTVEWGWHSPSIRALVDQPRGVRYQIKSVEPLSPDGTAILSRVVISR